MLRHPRMLPSLGAAATMKKTLNITGGTKSVSATLSFAATMDNISVVTTLLNRDGSTDTVVYGVD